MAKRFVPRVEGLDRRVVLSGMNPGLQMAAMAAYFQEHPADFVGPPEPVIQARDAPPPVEVEDFRFNPTRDDSGVAPQTTWGEEIRLMYEYFKSFFSANPGGPPEPVWLDLSRSLSSGL